MRVISGTARGRKLISPEGYDTRPTTDNVKESLFNIIQFDIEGRRVLDLFAGKCEDRFFTFDFDKDHILSCSLDL